MTRARRSVSAKRLASAFLCAATLFLLAAGATLAQSDPLLGTWKLNLEKSTFTNMHGPKSETRTIEVQGGITKVTYDGTAADGTHVAFSYSTDYSGKDFPVVGTGQSSGADTVAMKRVDANTTTAVAKKGDRVVQTATTVVSKDGKTMTITSNGTNASGQPTSFSMVWDKQ
jgi:hypothetical protein